MKIGVLAGGGDAPGLNTALKAVVMKSHEYGWEVVGIKRGWTGLLDCDVQALDPDVVKHIHSQGGIILYTSRTNPFAIENGSQKVIRNIKKLSLNALVAMGGEDTLSVAQKLYEMGVPVVGIPKTIDNDLSGTDYTIGFDTAVSIATDAIDRLRTTAESHQRVIIVEVMGRNTGWIALFAGLAGGAHMILIPEVPYSLSKIYETLKKRQSEGEVYSIIVVSEGANPIDMKNATIKSKQKDEFGHMRLGGISQVLERIIEEKTGFETRAVTLGHIQRSGTPTACDRVLAARLGVKAVELIKEGKFGMMSSLQGNNIVSVPLKDAIMQRKTVSLELYNLAQSFIK
jgi:6-phosphofructokinase 1